MTEAHPSGFNHDNCGLICELCGLAWFDLCTSKSWFEFICPQCVVIKSCLFNLFTLQRPSFSSKRTWRSSHQKMASNTIFSPKATKVIWDPRSYHSIRCVFLGTPRTHDFRDLPRRLLAPPWSNLATWVAVGELFNISSEDCRLHHGYIYITVEYHGDFFFWNLGWILPYSDGV